MPPDPSLFNLVAPNYQDRLFTSTVDILNLLVTQIEEIILANHIAPHLYLGMQTFSAFELFAAHYADLAEKSHKLTVFGHADKPPRQIANTEFIALPPDSTLTRERFLVVNHNAWQVALIAQEDAENTARWGRNLQYHGLLTFNPKVVERCNMITALLSGNRPQPIAQNDPTLHQQHIAQLATRAMLLTDIPDFDPAIALAEVPKLMELVQQIKGLNNHLERLTWFVEVAERLLNLEHVTLYRSEDTMLRPVVSNVSLERISGAVMGQGFIGLAAQQRQTISAPPGEVSRFTGDTTHRAAVAIPVDSPAWPNGWGVLLLATAAPDRLQAAQDNLTLAILISILQTLLLKDERPKNGSTAAPQPPAAPPLSATPTASTATRAQRGRIRLGPREEAAPAAAASVTPPLASDLNLVRLPQAQTISVQEDPMTDYQRRIIGHLLSFDRDGADRVWREAYSRFPARDLCVSLLQPVLIAVGEGWHRGQVSIAAEHFTTSYVESKIIGFLNSYPDNPNGATILTGCAQGETHETGIMMLSLFFRWDGHRVIYLGANVPNSTLEDALRTIKPDMLCLSATMKENGNNVTEVGHIIARLPEPRPLLGFGGAAFIFFPELRERVHGHYLGDEPNAILKNVRDLLAMRRQRLGQG